MTNPAHPDAPATAPPGSPALHAPGNLRARLHLAARAARLPKAPGTEPAETVRIERAIYGGAGLARTPAPAPPEPAGPTRFIPFTLPGELVQIDPQPTAADEFLPVAIPEPAPTRRDPPCPHFGPCGGCHYQHAGYPAQLALKQSILRETLERAGVRNLPEIQTVAGPEWGYRNRIRLRLQPQNAAFALGYSLRHTNDFLPIETCPISAPLLLKAAKTLLQIAANQPAFTAWLSAATELELFANGDETRLQLTLLGQRTPAAKKGSFESLCSALQTAIPELTAASFTLTDPRNPRKPPTVAAAWGQAGLLYTVRPPGFAAVTAADAPPDTTAPPTSTVSSTPAEEPFWISRGGFFQVNRFLIPDLLRLVTTTPDGVPRSGNIAWDLFAGVGLFARVLARHYAQVTAVEANPTAAADLANVLAKVLPRHSTPGSPHRAVQSPTLDFLRKAVLQRERPDLIVLDPPRAGAGIEACNLLTRLAPATLVYVSCDPSTLSRDLATLQPHFRLESLTLLDLFPQTFHLETVAILHRIS